MRILIIEDNEKNIENMLKHGRAKFGPHVLLAVVSNLKETSRILPFVKEAFDGVILDACLTQGDQIDTRFVPNELRRLVFEGIIMANSMNSYMNDLLISDGANCRNELGKSKAVEAIVRAYISRFFVRRGMSPPLTSMFVKLCINQDMMSVVAVTDRISAMDFSEKRSTNFIINSIIDGAVPLILNGGALELLRDCLDELK